MTKAANASSVDEVLRRGLLTLYSLLSTAGVTATAFQPPSMADQMSPGQIKVWGIFLLFGSVVCLAGVAIPRGAIGDWLGEYIGIWLVTAAIAVYGIVALSTISEVPGRVTGGLLLIAFCVLFAVRWFRVRDDKKKERTRIAQMPPT